MVREQRGRLLAAASNRGVRVETVDSDAPSEVARYASLLLSRHLRRRVPPPRPGRGVIPVSYETEGVRTALGGYGHGVAANTTEPAPAPTTARDPWFDNAKMALVSARRGRPRLDAAPAHRASTTTSTTSSTPGTSRRSCSSPATCPARSPGRRRRMWQLVSTVAVPYVLFECALALFRIHVGGEQLEDLFRDPHWPMWYLAALFFWRLLTPVFTAAARRGRRGGRRSRPAWSPGSTPATPSTWPGCWACCRSSCSACTATPERVERLREPGSATAAAGGLRSPSRSLTHLDRQPGADRVALLPLAATASSTSATRAPCSPAPG